MTKPIGAVDGNEVLEEERSFRWQQIETFIAARMGGFGGLRIIEIGSGHGTNAIHFAKRWTQAVVLDTSTEALRGALHVAEAAGVVLEPVLGVAFAPAEDWSDPSTSRVPSVVRAIRGRTKACDRCRAHVRQGRGLATIGVPNCRSFPYRARMGDLSWRGSWPIGTEVPFDAKELTGRLRAAGGRIEHVGYRSFAATMVGYSTNPFLHSAGRKGFRRP